MAHKLMKNGLLWVGKGMERVKRLGLTAEQKN